MYKKIYFLLFLFISNITFGQRIDQNFLPDRIILNLTEEPATSLAVTWRTISESPNPKVEVAKSTTWIDFKNNLSIFNASKEKFITDKDEVVYYYSAIIKNLEPGTNYVYRVGSDSVWSEWNQFYTAENKKYDFKFVYLGDPQNDLKEHCSRVFREAHRNSPDANFWLIGGDLVTDPYDDLWGEFFYAAGFIPRVIPIIAAPGNHDHSRILVDGKSRRSKEIASTWLTHFTLPENGPIEFKETSYYIDYQGTRFVIINSQSRVEEQSVWLEDVLKSNKNKWTIVCFHHPVYSTGSDRDDKATRESFQPLFDRYGVDLVLTGHDHTYARSKRIFNGKISEDESRGTIYVVSVSGPKAYPLGNKYNQLMVKTAEKVQLYQIIEVTENKISFAAYTVDGKPFDSFEITK